MSISVTTPKAVKYGMERQKEPTKQQQEGDEECDK